MDGTRKSIILSQVTHTQKDKYVVCLYVDLSCYVDDNLQTHGTTEVGYRVRVW